MINNEDFFVDPFDMIMECTDINDNDTTTTESEQMVTEQTDDVVTEAVAHKVLNEIKTLNKESIDELKALTKELKRKQKSLTKEEVLEKVARGKKIITDLKKEAQAIPDDDLEDDIKNALPAILAFLALIGALAIVGFLFFHIEGKNGGRTKTKENFIKTLTKAEAYLDKVKSKVESNLKVTQLSESVAFPERLMPYAEGANGYEDIIRNIEPDYVFGDITESEYQSMLKELDQYFEAVIEEFEVANMLPQCGSTDGVGDPHEVVDDVTKTDKTITGGVVKPEVIEITEDVALYLVQPELESNFMIESSIMESVKEIFSKHKLTAEAKRLITKRSVLKTRLRIAQEKKSSASVIREIKKDLLNTTKELRKLTRLMDNESKEKFDTLQKKMDVSMKKAQKKALRMVKESTGDLDEFDTEVLIEAANIEEEIKPIIDKLNAKGYTTKYSSPGHTKLRKKEDPDKDGVYYGKLYSDARVMFDDDYDFPKAPKYWEWKKVDGKDYLDVIPRSYDSKKGSSDDAFKKWKSDYMKSLKEWVDELPKKGESSKEEETKKEAEVLKESTFESYNSLIGDLLSSYELDLL